MLCGFPGKTFLNGQNLFFSYDLPIRYLDFFCGFPTSNIATIASSRIKTIK